MAIEVGRRGFITGLIALVAAPAVIRVAPLMKISVPTTPLFVPIDWIMEDGAVIIGKAGKAAFLEGHGWSRPLADNWVNVRDFDPALIKDWALRPGPEEYFLS